MDIKVLENLVNRYLSQYEIAEELQCSQTNVRYWLKKFDLKTKSAPTKKCPKCEENKNLSDFHNRRGLKGGSVYCISCSNKESVERARQFKIKCVEYKGGCCEKCGYDKYVGALQFHHLDPNEKDFALSKVKSHSFNEKIIRELDKCMLVCANCHFEIHGDIAQMEEPSITNRKVVSSNLSAATKETGHVSERGYLDNRI